MEFGTFFPEQVKKNLPSLSEVVLDFQEVQYCIFQLIFNNSENFTLLIQELYETNFLKYWILHDLL